MYDYVINTATIRIPFTTDIAFAEGVDAEEFGWESYVKVERKDWHECESESGVCLLSVDEVVIDGNELVVTLHEDSLMNYFDKVWVKVAANTVANAHYPGELQTVAQSLHDPQAEPGEGIGLVSGGAESEYQSEIEPLLDWNPYAFEFRITVAPDYVNIIKSTADPNGYVEIFLPTLFDLVQSPYNLEVSLNFEETIEGEIFYEWIPQESGGWNLRIPNQVLLDLSCEECYEEQIYEECFDGPNQCQNNYLVEHRLIISLLDIDFFWVFIAISEYPLV